MRHARWTAALVAILAVGVTTGCATKGYVVERVDERVGEVEGRVDGMETELDATAEATRRNAARLGEVDQTASGALSAAEAAGESATSANERAAALEAANRRLLFEVVLSEDHGQFAFAGADLPEPATASLDELVRRLQDHPTAVHIEVEGHTDATGPTAYNHRLGLQRAEAVRRYLHEQHRLPLHKINVITYGEEKPVAPNETSEGRAKNRRVVVRVLG